MSALKQLLDAGTSNAQPCFVASSVGTMVYNDGDMG